MNAPVLSVIIPVYNGEKFIARAVNSIEKQPCADAVEILIVDDGSKDHTGHICDDLAKTFSNISVFHIENGGVGNARNFAMEKVQTKYTAFLDADDLMAENFLEMSLVERFVSDDIDVYGFSYKKISEDFSQTVSFAVSEEKSELQSSKETVFSFDCYPFWSFVYRTEIIQKYGVKFGLTKINEDNVFLYCFFTCANTYQQMNKFILYYWQNIGSCIHSTKAEQFLTEKCQSLYLIRDWYQKYGLNYCWELDAIITFAYKIKEICAYHSYSYMQKFAKNSSVLPIVKQYRLYPVEGIPKTFKIIQNYLDHPFCFWFKCVTLERFKMVLRSFLLKHPKFHNQFRKYFYRNNPYQMVTDDEKAWIKACGQSFTNHL